MSRIHRRAMGCLLTSYPIQWHHNEYNGISNHQPHDCLLNHLFRRRSKKISKLCITGLCEGNSLVTSEFPTQRASNAENISIWRCHHDNETVLQWDIGFYMTNDTRCHVFISLPTSGVQVNHPGHPGWHTGCIVTKYTHMCCQYVIWFTL